MNNTVEVNTDKQRLLFHVEDIEIEILIDWLEKNQVRKYYLPTYTEIAKLERLSRKARKRCPSCGQEYNTNFKEQTNED